MHSMIRSYRVVASCFEPDIAQSIDERRDSLKAHLSALLEEQKPDLVVVPELAVIPDLHEQPNLGAEPVDGPTISMVVELAKMFSSNICMPIMEQDGDKKFNTAIFIDREGRIAGKFRKYVPTKGELDLGVSPGESSPEPVILDGLRIGTAICYDENFPDLMWNWMEKGVDLLLFPSYTYGGKMMQSWAVNCGVPLVVAFPWESVIYDRDGSILADGGTWTTTVRFGFHPAWVARDLNMQSRIYHLDYNQTKILEMGKKYGDKIDIRLMVREARMQITVLSDELDIDRLEREMQIVPLGEYLLNTRRHADSLRS